MPTAEKQQAVERLRERVDGAKCLYLTDFTGLDVAEMTDLRRRLTEARVDYLVVKNALAQRALEGTPYEALIEHLRGPNAFATSTDDVVSPAKILTDFAGDRERPAIKAGAIEGKIVSLEEIRRIASLPPREELLAQVVGYARAPMAGLLYTLHGLLSAFVRTLEAVRAQREAEGPSPMAEPEPQPAAAPDAPAVDDVDESENENGAELGAE